MEHEGQTNASRFPANRNARPPSGRGVLEARMMRLSEQMASCMWTGREDLVVVVLNNGGGRVSWQGNRSMRDRFWQHSISSSFHPFSPRFYVSKIACADIRRPTGMIEPYPTVWVLKICLP